MATVAHRLPLRVDQGGGDSFLPEQLQPEVLCAAAKAHGWTLDYTLHPDYDHSYCFIASLIEAHLRFHAGHLAGLEPVRMTVNRRFIGGFCCRAPNSRTKANNGGAMRSRMALSVNKTPGRWRSGSSRVGRGQLAAPGAATATLLAETPRQMSSNSHAVDNPASAASGLAAICAASRRRIAPPAPASACCARPPAWRPGSAANRRGGQRHARAHAQLHSHPARLRTVSRYIMSSPSRTARLTDAMRLGKLLHFGAITRRVKAGRGGGGQFQHRQAQLITAAGRVLIQITQLRERVGQPRHRAFGQASAAGQVLIDYQARRRERRQHRQPARQRGDKQAVLASDSVDSIGCPYVGRAVWRAQSDHGAADIRPRTWPCVILPLYIRLRFG